MATRRSRAGLASLLFLAAVACAPKKQQVQATVPLQPKQNLIVLLRLECGHLSDPDLSHLSIRGTYLQSIEMHDTSLFGMQMPDTIFTSFQS